MEEQWKDIKDFEGLYQISNWGKVKSFIKYKGTNERILKPRKVANGYLQISLSKDEKVFQKLVHRLVAEAFIPNEDLFKTQINHINEVKTDNKSENLEWVSPKENSNYGTRNERVAKAQSKEVIQFNLDGTFVKEWPSTMEVQRELGFAQTNISKCCLGKRKQAYGFIWKYKNEEDQQ